tara:strand:- start:1642 stop:3036 length:1395 start_codon:yes stop_codon:yes gene_type:complete
MKRVVITLGILIVLLAVGAWLTVSLSVGRFADSDYLVRQIESTFNCRAQIGDVKLNAYSAPARMEIVGLAFGPRDETVEKGILPSQRQPFAGSISIDYVMLELDRMPLFQRKLVVTNLQVERPTAELRIFDDGTNSLDDLLKPAPKRSNKTAAPTDEGTKAPKSSEDDRQFLATDIPISAIAERMAIEDLTVQATVEKSNTTVQLHRGVVVFRDIDLDPNSLTEHNSAKMEFSAWLGIDSFEHNLRYLDLSLEGNGDIQPFNVDSAQLDPSLSASVTVKRDSWIDALPLLDEMEDLIKQLENYGVDMEGVRLRGDFSEDTTASFNANRQELRMTTDFMVPIDENFVVLEQGSWVNAGKNDHQFFVTFLGSEKLTRKIETEVTKFLEKNVGELAAIPAREALMSTVKKRDFLVLRFKSTGDVGDPDVTAITPFGDIADLLKNPKSDTMKSLEDTAKSLLDSLLGN